MTANSILVLVIWGGFLIDSKFNTGVQAFQHQMQIQYKDLFFRNFEALKRAEEQLEREDLARKEVFC